MFGLLQKNKNKDGIGYFDNKASCSICNKDLSLKTLRSRFQLADGWLCSDCIKLAGGYSNLNRKKDTIEIVKEKIMKHQNDNLFENKKFDGIFSIKIDPNMDLTEEESNSLEEQMAKTHSQFKKLEELKKVYKSTINQHEYITNELWCKNTYHKVNSQSNIFNKYADRYIELCNMYLQILPDYINFEKESDYIFERESEYIYAPHDIVNMIRLLEKQEKYNEIINVCNYLLSLEITEDGTKKGIKGRIEKAVNKFNEKNNTNYKYYSDKNLIIDDNTGEVME